MYQEVEYRGVFNYDWQFSLNRSKKRTNELQIILVKQRTTTVLPKQCAEIAVVSHYERNDLIDIKINAVRGNLFTTYSKAPADTGRVTFVIGGRYDND